MEVQASKTPHPLLIAAAIAVIAFCGLGAAAIMGVIPTTIGAGSPTPPLQASASNTSPNTPAAKSHVDTVKSKPSATAATPSSVMGVASLKCADCGVIESVREVEQAGKGTGLGAVGGAVAGGLVGNQVGGGRGQDVMTVVGAVAGGLAGNQIEKKVRSTKSYDITVRMEDGTTRVLHESAAPSWRSGDKVKLVDGRIQAYAG